MLKVRPITLKQAKEFVAHEHRHHAPPVGHKFSIGLVTEKDLETLLGVVVVGRPVARNADDGFTSEVTRLATIGIKNGCSILYAAAARAAKAMGYNKIQTYILDEEPGTSLRAAGWVLDGFTPGGQWKHTAGPRRTDQPICPKQRWVKCLNS